MARDPRRLRDAEQCEQQGEPALRAQSKRDAGQQGIHTTERQG